MIKQKRNPFLKTDLADISERDLKNVALVSPEPTVNVVSSGRIGQKFVYLLCQNHNCITRAVNEDVPPNFYRDGAIIRCRYCRRPYVIASRKVSAGENEAYVQSLPASIEVVAHA